MKHDMIPKVTIISKPVNVLMYSVCHVWTHESITEEYGLDCEQSLVDNLTNNKLTEDRTLRRVLRELLLKYNWTNAIVYKYEKIVQ